MDQDGAGDGSGWFQETALSFTGIVTIISLCCCTTMSCVALCIKLASWMFGHRGRRRRILVLPPHAQYYHRQFNDAGEDDFYTGSPRPIIILGDDSSRQDNACGVESSEIELKEVPFGNIEEQRRTLKKDHDGGDAAVTPGACGDIGGPQRLNGISKGLERDTTNASMMTRTGTPSVNGEHRGISPSSSHDSKDFCGDGDDDNENDDDDDDDDDDRDGEDAGEEQKGQGQ